MLIYKAFNFWLIIYKAFDLTDDSESFWFDFQLKDIDRSERSPWLDLAEWKLEVSSRARQSSLDKVSS
jgi:hypothetical protein